MAGCSHPVRVHLNGQHGARASAPSGATARMMMVLSVVGDHRACSCADWRHASSSHRSVAEPETRDSSVVRTGEKRQGRPVRGAVERASERARELACLLDLLRHDTTQQQTGLTVIWAQLFSVARFNGRLC